MKKTIIKPLKDVNLDKPILIEGLPGIGYVGKLVAEHLINELHAKKFAELYSSAFPPQVFVGENGIIKPMKNEFYYLKSAGADHRDYIFLVGNAQGVTPNGLYDICGEIIDFIADYGVKDIYTLGGVGTSQYVKKVKVFGAATNVELTKMLEKHGVIIRSADENIIGASGLLLALGMNQGMDGACLRGETPGYFIDAEAAKAVFITLISILKLEVDIAKLEERAEETRKIISKTQQMTRDTGDNKHFTPNDDDLRYIR